MYSFFVSPKENKRGIDSERGDQQEETSLVFLFFNACAHQSELEIFNIEHARTRDTDIFNIEHTKVHIMSVIVHFMYIYLLSQNSRKYIY